MIDFEKIYDSFTDELAGNQKRLDVNTVLGVYYGVSSDGCLRLSFLSFGINSSTFLVKVLYIFIISPLFKYIT